MSTFYLSFGSIANLHNNTPKTASSIGELSNKARTYTKDPAVFTLPGVTSETVLYNFLAETDGVEIIMDTAIATVQLNISNWLYDQAKLGNITGSRGGTLSLLKAQFSVNIEITDIGEMVTNSAIWLPSFVSGHHLVSGVKHDFIIWYADEYFRTQFPRVTFTIIHPIPLDEFDNLMDMNYQQIAARFEMETPDVIEHRTDQLTNNAAWPYTERSVIPFDILDLINKPNKNKGYWRIINWGNGVDSEDQLFAQIQDEILENSKYTREEWEEKIPDLFNPLEFYVIPNYDRAGLNNKTTGTRSNSPITDYETCLDHANFYLTPGMTEPHVIKSLQLIPFLYKSTLCSFVSKTNNREGLKKIYNLYPDYQIIPSTDSEFDLMSLTTTEFILQMENLLAASERVTPTSLIPSGVTRIDRFDKVWVAKRVGAVKLIVLTKWQLREDGRLED